MSTEIKDQVAVEALQEKTTFVNSNHETTLSPGRNSCLYGEAGKQYSVVASNNDDELDAQVYIYDYKQGYLEYNKTIEPWGTTGELFQMSNKGYIRIYNTSSTEYSPKPEVTFKLKAR